MDDSRREKLPIYPQPQPPLTLIESPPPLTEHVRLARESTQHVLGGVKQHVDAVVSKWVRVERKVESEIRSIIAKDEPLTPGILYVGVAGLAGSVIARNRNILVRLLLPPTLLVLSAPYFLPHNSANLRAYLSRVEDKHFPEFAAQHTQLQKSLTSTFAGTWDRAEKLTGDVRRATGGVVSQVEQATGLKLGEALGRAKELGDGVRREVAREAPAATGGDSSGRVVGVVMEQQPVAEIIAQPSVDSAAARRSAEADARRVGSAFERAMQAAKVNMRDVHVAEPVAAAAQTNKEAVVEAGKDIKQAVKGAAKSTRDALRRVAEPEVSSRQDGGALANQTTQNAPGGGAPVNAVEPKARLPHESGPGGLVEPLLGKEESRRLV